jgi:hypothetical protein
MFYRLYPRSEDGRATVRGLICDEGGLHFGGVLELIAPSEVNGRTIYSVRTLAELNKALSAAFDSTVDLSRHQPALERIARLMTDSEWGLAQVTALQMRLPELGDEDAMVRLQSANDFLRFNPNHKPPGPGGGQFATTGNGGGNSAEDATRRTGAPDSTSIPSLSYRTMSGGPDQKLWGIKFELSEPSARGGYIIQRMDTHYEIEPPESKLTLNDPPFWEAFKVDAGSRHTTYVDNPLPDGRRPIGGGDDVWMGQIGLKGSHGVQVETGTARFYEGLTEDDLARRGFAVGNVPGQGTALMNTFDDPKLPEDRVSNSVVRVSRNRF